MWLPRAAPGWHGGLWLFNHVLPNIAPLIGVQASVSYGTAILAEAALSYLGLATTGDRPDLGAYAAGLAGVPF